MKAKRLLFCLLLSVMLTVTFIPTIAFGAQDDPHSITLLNFDSYDQEQGNIYVEHAGLSGLFYDDDNEQFVGYEGQEMNLNAWSTDDNYSIEYLYYYTESNEEDPSYVYYDEDKECYSFEMPAEDITLGVSLIENDPSGGDEDQYGTIIVKGWTQDDENPSVIVVIASTFFRVGDVVEEVIRDAQFVLQVV